VNRREFARRAVAGVAASAAFEARGAESWRDLADRGEALLSQGDATGALAAFEAAAGQVHAAEVELGIVRSHMQAGEYRVALSFAAHVAGAHRDEPGGIALYAWLLNAGGQDQAARRLLSAALAADPGNEALREVDLALRSPWPRPGPTLMAAPLRAAPFEWPRIASTGCSVVASGTLVGGMGAIAPLVPLRGATAVWLRNGLGQTVNAVVERSDEAIGLASLRLAAPLAMPASLEISDRAPFAGSPGSVVEFAVDAGAVPAWPLLRTGFFGRTPANDGGRPLGIGVPRGPHGGPVFDSVGRLVGMAVSGTGGEARFVGISEVANRLPLILGPLVNSPGPRAPVDGVYALSLRVALQVIVQR
jgi:hypothetical protein